MVVSLHQPQYIPWAGYFDKIAKSDCFVFLDQVQYKAREFQNRNKVCSKDGYIWLTVPVISKGKGRQKICDVLIDNQIPWQRKHLGSLAACYGKARHFTRYLPFFQEVYSKKWERLIDLNVRIIKYLLEQLSIATSLYFESELAVTGAKTERIIGICKSLSADTYLSGAGGRDYLKEDRFSQAGIKLVYQDFKPLKYRQQFRAEGDFLENMSVLDLLFNQGPESGRFMKS